MAAKGESPQNTQESKRKLGRGKHAKLTPEMEARKWQPGHSGNPGGRPKAKPFTERLRVRGEQLIKDRKGKPTDKTPWDVLVDAALQMAAKGDLEAIKFLVDRAEGKVPQPVVGRGGGAVEVAFTTPEENEARINEILNKVLNAPESPDVGAGGADEKESGR